jgi:hypothetical protein
MLYFHRQAADLGLTNALDVQPSQGIFHAIKLYHRVRAREKEAGKTPS